MIYDPVTRKNMRRTEGGSMFRLIATMRRGSASGMPQAWARYAALETARSGAAELLRDDRVVRVMVVRNEVPPAFVEWGGR